MSIDSVRKQTVFLNIATVLGSLGTCDRGKVGALIVKEGRCISWGYNGAPPGLPHCDENNHGWTYDWEVDQHGCRNTTHAEANAVAAAAKQGISTEGTTMYCECSPCATCARLLIAAGIVAVVYHRPYRDNAGRQLLIEAKCDLRQH